MKKISLVILLISTFGFSQEKITKNLGDFHVLKVYRGLTVELIKSDKPKIVIDGSKSKHVTVKNVNGVLKISLKVLETFSAKEVSVTVYFSNNITTIDANEGSIIKSERIIKQNKIVLKVQEASEIKLEIGVSEVEIKAISGGKIILEGYAENQKINTNMGGDYNGSNFKTKKAKVSASSGAIAIVNASELVEANANLGGTITINGDPKEVIKKESLGGYVRQ